MLRRSAFLVSLGLLLAACSGRGGLSQDPEVQNRWTEQQAAALAYQQWDLYARGILQRKGEAYNVNIRWQREVDGRFRMILEAPFGQGVLRVEQVAAQQYRLHLPDGQLFQNSSPEALLDDAVGWSLPIAGLDFWVRGIADERSQDSVQLDTFGRARSIRQDGWDIDYLDYFETTTAPALPRRLRLSNDELSFRLVIERWQRLAIEADDTDLFPGFD